MRKPSATRFNPSNSPYWLRRSRQMKSEIWIDKLIGGCKVTLVQNFIDQSEYQRLIIREDFHQAPPNGNRCQS